MAMISFASRLRSLVARNADIALAEPAADTGSPAGTPPLGEIATTGNGRDITRPWVAELEQPLDRRLWGPVDWGPYERVRKDDQVKACMEQRIRAVVKCGWQVVSGDESDPRAQQAADALEARLNLIGWDRITEKMLWAEFYGIAVAELLWADIENLWQFSRIKVRHARRFRYDKDGKLRLLTVARPQGEIVPDRKFWVVRAGGTDDDVTYGEGLADWLYWPVVFKRNGVRFWNIFLDKYSVPTAKGTYPRGASAEEIAKALEAVQAIATDSGIVVPEGFVIELLEQAKAGADFGAVCRYMDGSIAKIILGQTMTTDSGAAGLGSNQADVHADVKEEIIKASADLLTDSFTEGPSRWFTDYNFGTDVAAPIVRRVVEQPADLKAEAEKDKTLSDMGWELTDEAFTDRYGEGYERTGKPDPASAAAVPMPSTPGAKPEVPAADDQVALAETLAPPANPRDIVDDATDALMANDGWRRVMAPMVGPLLEAIRNATSLDEVRALIAREAELGDDAALADALARAGFATRIDALTDDGQDG